MLCGFLLPLGEKRLQTEKSNSQFTTFFVPFVYILEKLKETI